jgi:hypothetical protein
MEHAVEIENIKKDLRVAQDSVLLIHQDLKQMSRGITEMASSMKVMVEVQSDMRLMNDRAESRYLTQKVTNERLDLRIDATNKTIKDKSDVIETQARNGDAAYTALKWIAGILGTLLITSAFGSWLYVLSIQGVN